MRSFTAVLLLLLWGTATVHCGLELDGLFGPASAHPGKVAGHHSARADNDPDGCSAIESGHFDSFVASFVVMPPIRIEAAEPFSAEPLAPRCDALARPPLACQSPPRVWGASWNFRRRTALPARAPDVVG